MAKYINEQGEAYNGRYVISEGVKYLHPSERKLEELGYSKVEEMQEEPMANTYEPTIEERLTELKQQLQDISNAITQLENEQKEIQ